jgi:ketosteroid isomerase-like protein
MSAVGAIAQRLTVTEWLERYRMAWERGDDAWIEELFTEDASYRSSPFRTPHLGHDGIREYWRGATRTQGDVRVTMGRPFVDGDRVVAEWWTTLRDEEQEYTLPGALILRFAEDGRVRELREYWHVEPGARDPHEGWGR